MEATSALDRPSSLLARSIFAPEGSSFTAATSTSNTLSSAAIAGIVLGSIAGAAVIGALIYLCGLSHSVASFIRYSSPRQSKTPPSHESPLNYDLPSALFQRNKHTSPPSPNPIDWMSGPNTPTNPATATSQHGYEVISPMSFVGSPNVANSQVYNIQSSPSEPMWDPFSCNHHNPEISPRCHVNANDGYAVTRYVISPNRELS